MSKIKLKEEELLKNESILDANTEDINASAVKKPRKPKPALDQSYQKCGPQSRRSLFKSECRHSI